MLSVDTLQTVEIRVGWGTDKHFSDQEHMYDQFFCRTVSFLSYKEYSNEITNFWGFGLMASCQKLGIILVKSNFEIATFKKMGIILENEVI